MCHIGHTVKLATRSNWPHGQIGHTPGQIGHTVRQIGHKMRQMGGITSKTQHNATESSRTTKKLPTHSTVHWYDDDSSMTVVAAITVS